jgi:hypothetical protein
MMDCSERCLNRKHSILPNTPTAGEILCKFREAVPVKNSQLSTHYEKESETALGMTDVDLASAQTS